MKIRPGKVKKEEHSLLIVTHTSKASDSILLVEPAKIIKSTNFYVNCFAIISINKILISTKVLQFIKQA